jgi:1-acyl-sn-glycerol-3-phosphate acyltransferase
MKIKFTFRGTISLLYFFISVLISVLFMLPAFLLIPFGLRKAGYRYLNRLGKLYSRNLLFVFGARVNVQGIENLPETNNICLVSNHQGIMDILLITGYIPKTVGFVAKKELARIPVMNIWLKAMGCVLIDRKDPRKTMSTIQKALKQIQKGYAMVIFPEGTRSRSSRMGKFKPGSFKLALGANTFAVPVTINGTYKIFEETGAITPGEVSLTIHPAIEISTLSEEEKKQLHQTVENIVRSGLKTS